MRDSEAKEVPRRLTSETGPGNLARRCSKAPGDALAFSAGPSTKRTARRLCVVCFEEGGCFGGEICGAAWLISADTRIDVVVDLVC